MYKISVFDTSISDYNLGNQIIMESVYKYLSEIFPDDFFFKLPYMEITGHTIDYLKRSDFKFFGGTNSLSGRMESYRQWDISLRKSFSVKDVVLMGIGWWQYENKTSWYTNTLLHRVLSKQYQHSVRDSHTEEKLREIGFKNVLNTGCPTLWDLNPQHCLSIPVAKANEVVFTFTDYHKNRERDKHILKCLASNYSSLHYWIQGEGDLDYIREIQDDIQVKLISPNLNAFDNVLKSMPVDYVGTRLHAGIRALQMGRRAIIIGVDNRAIEMNKDFNIPVLDQKAISSLNQRINSQTPVVINLPVDKIEAWKAQFNKYKHQ
jgi:polysaccharide pyruvyl transferase WcaK-like protein